MVKSMTKKLGIPVLASVNIPGEFVEVGMLSNISKIIVETVNGLRNQSKEKVEEEEIK